MKLKQIIPILVLVFFATIVFSNTASASNQTPSIENAQELAEKYAPVLYFHSAEIFRPQSVEVMLNTARLRQHVPYWFDVNVLNEIGITDLINFQNPDYFLDVWYGTSGASDYKNYSAHRAYYEAVLSPESGGPPVVAYAHVAQDEESGLISIQYWLFYYYNDWFNKHEGDWELVEVILDVDENPLWVILSQHHGGTRRAWEYAQIEKDSHPVAYVAQGSHANYFWADETYPNGMDIGSTRVEIMDRTGKTSRVIPQVILVPDRGLAANSPQPWVEFPGKWGERAFQGDFGGPLGPADKGFQWEQPIQWGLEQPLDADTWYANRLRVSVIGEGDDEVAISLLDSNQEHLPYSESLGNTALLHRDPIPGETIYAQIDSLHCLLADISVIIPDQESSQITEYTFKTIDLLDGRATIAIQPHTPPALTISLSNETFHPTVEQTKPATWDAPELIWIAGILPASDVVKGVVLSLLAGIIPTILYMLALYLPDKYEKEPKGLIAAAFLWGALPSVLIALGVSIFFQLPADLLGPQAIEAVRAGLVTPLIEEILKGAVILFIARRYRHEFDNVLDGIIYGAMVGFGFAMTGNIISYLGAFLLRGFSGLNATIFIQGIFYSFDHGFYSAIFGAGLGYARLSTNKKQALWYSIGAFLLAILTNALHNLAIRNATGFNLLTILLTLVGVSVTVVVMVWSLRRQRRILAEELPGEIPENIYNALLSAKQKTKLNKQILNSEGVKGLRKLRKIYRLSGELAFKKIQHKHFPDEEIITEKLNTLRSELYNLTNPRG